MKTLHIGDILSSTIGMPVSPRHMDGVHELLEYMAGEPVWTHQLSRVNDEAAPVLREQFPDLAAIEAPAKFTGKEHVDAWLAEQVATHGEFRDVAPLAAAEHTSIGPMEEFGLMGLSDKVIPVVVQDGAVTDGAA